MNNARWPRTGGVCDSAHAGHAGGRALGIIDLHLLAGQETQAVELFRCQVPQLGHEALDGVVVAGKPVLVDQILVDGHGVALEPQLGLDELAVGLVQGGGRGGAV